MVTARTRAHTNKNQNSTHVFSSSVSRPNVFGKDTATDEWIMVDFSSTYWIIISHTRMVDTTKGLWDNTWKTHKQSRALYRTVLPISHKLTNAINKWHFTNKYLTKLEKSYYISSSFVKNKIKINLCYQYQNMILCVLHIYSTEKQQ